MKLFHIECSGKYWYIAAYTRKQAIEKWEAYLSGPLSLLKLEDVVSQTVKVEMRADEIII